MMQVFNYTYDSMLSSYFQNEAVQVTTWQYKEKFKEKKNYQSETKAEKDTSETVSDQFKEMRFNDFLLTLFLYLRS